MKLVYVCGQLTHPSQQVMGERRVHARRKGEAVEAAGRFMAFVPHIHILEPPGDSPEEVWKSAMRRCLTMLRRCDYILLMDGWEHSRGARIEVWLCRRRTGFPKIVHSIADLQVEADHG